MSLANDSSYNPDLEPAAEMQDRDELGCTYYDAFQCGKTRIPIILSTEYRPLVQCTY